MHNPWVARAGWLAVVLFFGAAFGIPIAVRMGWVGPGPSHDTLAAQLRHKGIAVTIQQKDAEIAIFTEQDTGLTVLVARASSTSEARKALTRLDSSNSDGAFVTGRFVIAAPRAGDGALLSRIRGALD